MIAITERKHWFLEDVFNVVVKCCNYVLDCRKQRVAAMRVHANKVKDD